MFKARVDFAFENSQEIIDWLFALNKNNMSACCIEKNGPGGGWPIMEIISYSKENLVNFLKEFHSTEIVFIE